MKALDIYIQYQNRANTNARNYSILQWGNGLTFPKINSKTVNKKG